MLWQYVFRPSSTPWALSCSRRGVHEVVDQHTDAQVPFDASIIAVEYRAQPQVGLQRPEHRFQLGESATYLTMPMLWAMNR